MKESDYYPAGAYNDPNAPWNDIILPEEEFEVTLSQSLSKSVTVWTNDYILYLEYGGYCKDTSETDWKEAFKDNNHYTPLQLIQILEEYVKKDLKGVEEKLEENKKDLQAAERFKYLNNLLVECQEWNDDETEIVEG